MPSSKFTSKFLFFAFIAIIIITHTKLLPQVKGLSIEHEKLAVVQGQEDAPNSSDKLDSPTGRKIARINSSLKEVADSLNNNCGSESSLLQQRAEHNTPQMASPSSIPYSPVLSPYMHQHHYRPPYERSASTAPPATSQG